MSSFEFAEMKWNEIKHSRVHFSFDGTLRWYSMVHFASDDLTDYNGYEEGSVLLLTHFMHYM